MVSRTVRAVRHVKAISSWETLTTDLDELSSIEITIIENYYIVISKQNKRRLEFMARESSIQLIYQNAIILYQYLHPPLFQLDFTSWSNPGAVWVISVMIQLGSVLTSAFSTIFPIIEEMQFQYALQSKKDYDLWGYIIKVIQAELNIGYYILYIVVYWNLKQK